MSFGWRQRMCALCWVACVFSAAPAQAERLRVGYFDLPPHTDLALPGGKQGLALQYFQRISAQMGVEEVSLTGYPLARLLYMLQEERLDMALFLGKTPEREALLSYAREPLLVATPVVAVTRLQPLRQIRTVEDLLPLRLGVWQSGYRSPMLRDPRLQITTVSSEHVVAQSLRMLLAGRIDGFYFPDLLAVRYEVARAGQQAEIRLLALPGPGVALYSVFSRRSAVIFQQRYEQALETVKRQQDYQGFFQQHVAPSKDR